MMEKKPIIIVEGKYDVSIVKKITDAPVIQTNGFSIFNNKKLDDFIKKYAPENGIVILTDSDRAGFTIRHHIESLVDKKYIKNAYIPRIQGKEKRKDRPSKENVLGVEGMTEQTLRRALEQAGVDFGQEKNGDVISKTDLYNDGLIGKKDSREKRRILLQKLDLPDFLSSNRLLDILNASVSKDEYNEIMKEINKTV